MVPQEVLEAEAERKAIEEWEALEASVEAEFEALRSRDPNDHVVPNHCGKWLFSWSNLSIACPILLFLVTEKHDMLRILPFSPTASAVCAVCIRKCGIGKHRQ